MNDTVWDAIVVGAGIAGAATALGLKRAFGRSGRVMLCDPALPAIPTGATLRAVAIAPDTRSFLEMLGVWASVSSQAQPVVAMAITDARPGRLPNPTLLSFGDVDARGEPLAHIVPADPLRIALLQACAEAGVVLDPGRGGGVDPAPWSTTLALLDGRKLRTRLIAAADGSRSRLRAAARIQVVETAYDQSAITATLRHRDDHAGRATQHFFPGGPVALLPMRSDDGSRTRSSLVWTETRPEAERLAGLADDRFCAELEERVGLALGPFSLEDRPRAYPLALLVARDLTAARFALIGDAARVIHPLAGQGLNLGLRDAAALARHAGNAAGLGLDPGGSSVLAAYASDRRMESGLMAAGTDALDRLFSTDRPLIRAVRDAGLSAVDKMPALKRRFARQARGSR